MQSNQENNFNEQNCKPGVVKHYGISNPFMKKVAKILF